MQQALKEGIALSDVPMLVAVALTLVAATAAAAYVPARRALSVPPSLAMRS